MKKIMLSLMAVMSMTFAMAQQVNHTVQRGETLESIAQKYNISVNALKTANPDATEMFYVGMKLNIPSQSSTNAQQASNNNTGRPAASSNNSVIYKPQSSYRHSSDKDFEVEVLAGLSLGTWTGSDVKDVNMLTGFHAGLAGRYYLGDNVFTEAALMFGTKGYKVESPDATMKTYNLDVPLNIGYAFNLSDNMKLRLKVGPYITYALSGELKVKGSGKSPSGNNNQQSGPGNGQQGGPDGQQGGGDGPDGQQGGAGQSPNGQQGDSNAQQSEGGPTTTKLKDMKAYNTFNVGIDAGIALEAGHFVVAATFQRGLGTLLVDTKSYEQNIFVTLGYKF